jgi:RNA polymerase sigma-70 factor (ECF subfamily)
VPVSDYGQYRPLLFSIAYRMTSSVSDAEDIVQAYLATATTRLAINHLQSARVRRESYVGAWLPEPLIAEPGPEEHAEMADSLSMAFLIVLESLSPAERAVFLLHEVFGYEHGEIATIVGKSEPACRQILARARRHVDEGHPRFEVSREQKDQVAQRFFAAAGGGDIDELLRALAPDVVFTGDGGGKAQAIAVPMHGRDRVARFVAGLFRRGRTEGASIQFAQVNGQPGAVAYNSSGQVVSVFVLDVVLTGDGDGAVQAIRCVVNPDKLHHLGPASEMARKSSRD